MTESPEVANYKSVFEAAEKELATKYLNAFGGFLAEFGLDQFDRNDPGAIIEAINLCKRYHGGLTSKDNEKLIEGLKKQLADIKLNLEQQPRAERSTEPMIWDDLLKEGKEIVADIEKFVTKTYGQMIILLNRAIIKGKFLSIVHLTEQVRNSGILFQ